MNEEDSEEEEEEEEGLLKANAVNWEERVSQTPNIPSASLFAA